MLLFSHLLLHTMCYTLGIKKMAFAMKQTFQFYDRLTGSGLTESQARVIIEAIEDLHEVDLKELATKSDLKALALATSSDIKALTLATRSNFQAFRSDLEKLALATSSAISACATKEDLKEYSTKADLKILKSGLETKMEDTKSSSIKWVAGIVLGGIWIPLALGLFVKHLGLF